MIDLTYFDEDRVYESNRRVCEHCGVDELDGTYMINDNIELCEGCYMKYLDEFEKDLEKLLVNYSFKVKASDLVDDLSGRLDKI